MHATFAGLCAFLAAAASAAATSISAVSQVTHFDDLQGNIAVAQPVPNPYRNLNFSGFAVGAASPVSVVALRPSSLQNFATAPGTFSLLSPVLISTAGTKTKAFDLNALNIGCYAALRNGAAAPPLDCTLNLNATKAGTGQKVSTTIGFRTGGPLGVSTKSMAVKPVKLPDSFKLLSQVQLTIASSAAPNVAGASVQFAIDDVKNVVHILK